MRFRLIATYSGATYQAALGPGGDEVTLFAACPPPEELGFSSAAGHWRKLVGLDDIDGLRESRPAGIYRGAECLVLDDQGERLHIAYLGEDAEQARELGYFEIDRDVFELVVPRAAVMDLTEVQLDIPIQAAVIPRPVAAPVPLSAPIEWEEPVEPTETVDWTDEQGDWTDEQGDWADEPEPVDPPVTAVPVNSNGVTVSSNGVPVSSNGHRTLDRMAAWHGSPEPWPAQEQYGAPNGHGDALNGYANGHGNGNGTRSAGPRATRRERVPIQAVFTELADLAAIPPSSYALDDEVPGAMCLLKTNDGFEVFASSDEARHEVRFFEDEEAAYFYLFGVLAAEAIRNGRLLPVAPTSRTRRENISKYLRQRISHNYPPNPVRVLNSRRG
jgi:hypothetical protein